MQPGRNTNLAGVGKRSCQPHLPTLNWWCKTLFCQLDVSLEEGSISLLVLFFQRDLFLLASPQAGPDGWLLTADTALGGAVASPRREDTPQQHQTSGTSPRGRHSSATAVSLRDLAGFTHLGDNHCQSFKTSKHLFLLCYSDLFHLQVTNRTSTQICLRKKESVDSQGEFPGLAGSKALKNVPGLSSCSGSPLYSLQASLAPAFWKHSLWQSQEHQKYIPWTKGGCPTRFNRKGQRRALAFQEDP